MLGDVVGTVDGDALEVLPQREEVVEEGGGPRNAGADQLLELGMGVGGGPPLLGRERVVERQHVDVVRQPLRPQLSQLLLEPLRPGKVLVHPLVEAVALGD